MGQGEPSFPLQCSRLDPENDRIADNFLSFRSIQNEIPIPRTAKQKKRQTLGPRDTRFSARPQSSRVDSVLDVYAELYADEEDEGGYEVHSGRQEDLMPYDAHAQPAQPWDERGKNGLYGGGGRGADDQETGWVRGYSIGSAQPSPGFEEDLRYDQDEPEIDDPRSSTETVQSGSYPVTPTSSHFPAPPTSTTLCDSPPSTVPRPQSGYISTHSRNVSAAKSPFHTPERPLRTASPARDAPLTPSDSVVLRKKGPQPTSFPSPSAPLRPSAPVDAPVSLSQDSPRPTIKRSNSLFKLRGRSKRPPPISNPILPDGFVESLGMKTFTLTPGCKAPLYGQDRVPSPAPTTPRSAERSQPSTPRTPDRPRPLHNLPPRAPHDTPPVRPSPPHSRSSASPRKNSPNSSISSAQLPLGQGHGFRGSVDRQSDFYPHEAMTRLSMSSEVSTRSDPTGPHSSNGPNHRQFFDQLRQERSRHEEVQANRGVAVTNAGSIPSIPLPSNRDSWGPDFTKRVPVKPVLSNMDSHRSERTMKGGGGHWSAPAPSREDERGVSVHYEPTKPEEDSEVDDSADSSYSEYSGVDSRRASATNNFAHDLSYYAQPQGGTEETRYTLDTGGGYDRTSQMETLRPEEDEVDDYFPTSHYAAPPVKPLNVRRTPPLAYTSSSLPSTSSSGTPKALAQFNRGAGAAINRNSSIDPFSSFAGPKKSKVHEGPAIGATGFRNPFG